MLSSLLGTYDIMQMVGLSISYLRVMGIHQPRTVVTLPTIIPQWEGHQNPRYPHSNASEPPDDFDGQWEQEGYYGAPHQNRNPPYHGLY